MGKIIPVFTQGTDAAGNVFMYGDEEARAELENLKPSNIPVGTRIIAAVPLQPQTLYGGTWVEESYHNFNGDYVYTKISMAVVESTETPETTPETEEGEQANDPQ